MSVSSCIPEKMPREQVDTRPGSCDHRGACGHTPRELRSPRGGWGLLSVPSRQPARARRGGASRSSRKETRKLPRSPAQGGRSAWSQSHRAVKGLPEALAARASSEGALLGAPRADSGDGAGQERSQSGGGLGTMFPKQGFPGGSAGKESSCTSFLLTPPSFSREHSPPWVAGPGCFHTPRTSPLNAGHMARMCPYNRGVFPSPA